MPVLAHDRVTADDTTPDRWMLFLHGIYGSGRNWGSVARRFVRARPDWGAVLVDLRMHGDSTGFEPPHTVEACAADLHDMVRSTGLRADAVLGHSFGGKVALVWATTAAPERVWVVDSTPGTRPPAGSAWEMLAALRDHPGPFAVRAAGVAAIESAGFPTPVAQWMATNLTPRDDGSLGWRLDVDAMEALMLDFFRTDAWDGVEAPPTGTRVHVVKAEESTVLSEEACQRVERAPSATLHRVPGGHWVNADAPEELHRLLMDGMG